MVLHLLLIILLLCVLARPQRRKENSGRFFTQGFLWNFFHAKIVAEAIRATAARVPTIAPAMTPPFPLFDSSIRVESNGADESGPLDLPGTTGRRETCGEFGELERLEEKTGDAEETGSGAGNKGTDGGFAGAAKFDWEG
jgi:hypothetical protein